MDAKQLKVHENTIRRIAQRRGMMISKTRTRDPYLPTYAQWSLIDRETGDVLATAYSIDGIEAELERVSAARRARLVA